MHSDTNIYINVLKDSLVQKQQNLEKILDLTKKQEEVLKREEVDMDDFNGYMDEKKIYIERLLQLERGFENIYQKVQKEIQENKELYKDTILIMQDLIRKITESSSKIQVIEARNKERFQNYLLKEKRGIKEFRQNSKVMDSYQQSMGIQGKVGQSYFMDQKK